MEAPKSIGQALEQAGALLRGLTLGQRALLAGGAALIAVTLWLFVGLIAKPKYATLYSGLKPEEAQALGTRLAAKNIPHELSPDGTGLLVPADQLDAARLETAAQGLPRNARLGFELFDTPNWAGSDFTEKVNYQRALEGELERTLQTLSEVEAVRVHLVLPRESLFSEQEREAKAAVILKTRGGALSERAQLAIPQLVASAVDGLRPENVTVVDADSNTPLLHAHGPGAGHGGYDLDEELAKTLLRTLEPVVGAEHVRASVHVEYDLSTSENTEEVYDPKTTATLTQQKSEENAGGGGPAGIPGTASNVPGATAAATATAVAMTAETQNSHSESETYAVSKSVRHTVQPPGRVKRLAAAVLVDDAVEMADKNGVKTATRRKRTPEEMKEIEQLAGAAIGLDAQRGDMLAVQNLVLPGTSGGKTGAAGQTGKYPQDIHPMVRPVALCGHRGAVPDRLLSDAASGEEAGPDCAARVAGADGARPERTGGGSDGRGGFEIEPAGTEQARRASTLKRQLSEKVKTEPAVASRLVQSWIREEGKE